MRFIRNREKILSRLYMSPTYFSLPEAPDAERPASSYALNDRLGDVSLIGLGKLDGAEFTPHPVFGVGVPKSCPDVPAEFLDARGMWTDKQAYDEGARALAGRFHENFRKFANAGKEIREAGPRVDS